MDLEQLKSEWQQADDGPNMPMDQLYKILKMKTRKSMGRFRFRLIVESLALAFFLLLFYDAFDGFNKPWALNLLLGIAVGGTILHNLYALRFIHLGLQGQDLRESLRFMSQRFRQQGGVAALLLIAYNLAWLSFASVNVELSQFVILGLSFAFLVVLAVAFFTNRTWQKQAKAMEMRLEELEN
ncbi:MAG: hypothetical protein AAFN10_00430 [Bacteroidota bacterium]